MLLQLPRADARTAPRIRHRCPSCPDRHDGFPALSYGRPDVIFALSPDERRRRAMVSADLCILDDARYFARCTLKVSVQTCDEEFEYGPWVELSTRDFCRYSLVLNMGCGGDGSGGHPTWTGAVGRLANALPTGGSSTLGVNCAIVPAGQPGQRPTVEITDRTHDLYRKQAEGMSVPYAVDIVSRMKGFFLLVD